MCSRLVRLGSFFLNHYFRRGYVSTWGPAYRACSLTGWNKEGTWLLYWVCKVSIRSLRRSDEHLFYIASSSFTTFVNETGMALHIYIHAAFALSDFVKTLFPSINLLLFLCWVARACNSRHQPLMGPPVGSVSFYVLHIVIIYLPIHLKFNIWFDYISEYFWKDYSKSTIYMVDL